MTNQPVIHFRTFVTLILNVTILSSICALSAFTALAADRSKMRAHTHSDGRYHILQNEVPVRSQAGKKPSPALTRTTTPNPNPTRAYAPAPTVTVVPTPIVLFKDTFSYPDRLITNEFAYWNPGLSQSIASPLWQMDSGSLFAKSARAWTGFPNAVPPNATSGNGNNSAIFRLTTRRSDFGSVRVAFNLVNNRFVFTPKTPASNTDGVHVWLRYRAENHLYILSVNRRDNTVAIKKKAPGGSTNGGTYYLLASGSNPVVFGQSTSVLVTARNNSDGSVTLQLFSNGVLRARATDNGSVGGPAITNAGRVGVRGDNDDFTFDNFVVTSLQ